MKVLLDRPILVLTLFLLVSILGIYSAINLPLELIPDLKLPRLKIAIFWPGTAAEVILNRAILPLEEELATIKEVKKIDSETFQNRGEISLELDKGSNIDLAYILIKERINRLKNKLPDQISLIEIKSESPEELRADSFMEVAVSSTQINDTNQLRLEFERDVLPKLKSIFGIKEIHVTGGSDVMVKIVPDFQKMEQQQINLRSLFSVLQNNFLSFPSTRLWKEKEAVNLLLSSQPNSIQDISQVVVSQDENRRILLSDIALITFGYGEQQQEARLNGFPTLIVSIQKQPYASSLKVDRTIRDLFEIVEKKSSQHFRFKIISSSGEKISSKLSELLKLALLIFLLIFIFLAIIVRSLPATLLIFSAIIFSTLSTFSLIFFFKIPLNILTLSALAICFGMYVDNAVVVFDNIMLLRQKGIEKSTAALRGSTEVFFAVLASTLTTVIVFFSFALFQERLRAYYLPIAQVVSLALLSSVAVSYLLIPTFSFRLPLKFKELKTESRKNRFLSSLVRYPLFVLLPLIALLIFSGLHFKNKLNFGRFFSWIPDEELFVSLEMPEGTLFSDIKKEILNFEKEALNFSGEREVSVRIFDNNAYMRVVFGKKTIQSDLPHRMRERLISLATNLAGVNIGVFGFDPQGGYSSRSSGFSFLPYSILIKGYNFERLLQLCNELKSSLLENRRVSEIEIATSSGWSWGKRKFYQLTLKKDELAKYQLTPSYALFFLEQLLPGSRNYQRRIRLVDRDYFLELSAQNREERELEDILNKIFFTNDGRAFRFKDFVNIRLITFSSQSIRREDQEYFARVSWDYLGSSKKAERFYKQTFAALQPPPGFKKSEPERSWLLSKKEEKQLKEVLVFAFLLIVLVLAILYNSVWQALIILTTIPLALLGIGWGFVISDFNFDSAAYIGVVLVMGVVVNNAIIMVNHINVLRRAGIELTRAIAQGTRERIRPVLMTTLTTVFGSALFVLRSSYRDETDIWTTFALCNLSGLISSSLLIFFVLPPVYCLVEKLSLMLRESFNNRFFSKKKDRSQK